MSQNIINLIVDHLKQQTDIEREAELITFDLKEDTVLSCCMHIVR